MYLLKTLHLADSVDNLPNHSLIAVAHYHSGSHALNDPYQTPRYHCPQGTPDAQCHNMSQRCYHHWPWPAEVLSLPDP